MTLMIGVSGSACRSGSATGLCWRAGCISRGAMSVRIFTDWCIRRFIDGRLSAVASAKVKLLVMNLHCKAVDQCLQFCGG